MKKQILIGGLLAVLAIPATTSCSSDYLDEDPRTQISASTISNTEEGAQAAVTQLARQMSCQFSDLKNGNLNASGELFFRNLYGEGLGADENVGEITNYYSSIPFSNFRLITGWWGAWMYDYCYSIIGIANSILYDIPEDNDSLSDLESWLKGCALTFRAHSYLRLMQVYAPRWVDSNNGEEYCLVLRIDAADTGDHPLNTCNEVFDQMYSDLNSAIECFGKTTVSRGENLYYPDISVARGIFAQFAMLKNDYTTAQKMAHDARQNYPLMTSDEYLNGFSTTCDGWMWAPCMDCNGLFYWQFGPHYACNGHYTNSWGYSDNMDYALYRLLEPTDVRSRLYFGPMSVDFEPELAAEYGITKEDFFDESLPLQTTVGVSITGTGDAPTAKRKAMWDFIQAYGNTFADRRPEDIKGIYPTNKKGISMGVQYKFQGLPDGYTSCFPPYMRSEEMLLLEAEAAYQNNDATTALNCLKELMAERDDTYSFSGTGSALLAEIQLQRRIELWGEGFSWFDLKRWGLPIERKAWDPADPDNSGNWPNTKARTFEPDFMNGWRAAIPQSEFTYNKAADQSLLGL